MPEVAILVQLREVHVHIIVRLVDLMVIGPSVTNRPGLIGSLIGCERSPSQWPSPSAGSWGFLGGKRPPLTSGLWAGYRANEKHANEVPWSGTLVAVEAAKCLGVRES